MSARPYPPLSRKIVNAIMLSLTGLCTLLVISVLLTILVYLLWNGIHALNLDFFIKLPAQVGQPGGGVANAIVGTLKLLLLASAIGVPVGVLGGIYLSEFGSGWSAFTVRYTTDLLNGVPSVVIGIFVYTLVVLPMHHFSTLAGGIALGIMMIPIALRSTEEFLRAVPRSLREGGLALGASKSETIFTIVIPAAIYGIITGIMLDVARVAGETAPLLFTAFGNQFNSPGWLQPTSSLPVVIYNYAISPYDDWHQQAWAAGFVLLSGLLLVSILARLILSRRKHMARG
jgi:phosphate transport system permease protein